MTAFVFANYVDTTLAAAVSSTATSLSLSSSANLPVLAPGEIMPLTLNDAATGLVYEIVYVTAISGTTLTVERAQEGTTAQNWSSGDYAFVSPTADTVSPVVGTHSPVASETLPAVNRLVVTPGTLTADIDLTLNDQAVAGSSVTVFGSASDYTVTVQSPVTTGSPYIELPDGSQVYSWTIPAASPSQGIHVDWDGTNWRARTFGQAVVAPANADNEAVQLGQAFQLLTPTASETITLGNTLETEVQPRDGITADITLTLEPGSVEGQKVICYGAGSAYAVTIQSNVTTGSPEFAYPDNSTNYSWTIPTGASVQGIILTWDGANWRAKTFGQEVVAPATQNNAAVQLGQVLSVTPQYHQQGYTPVSGDTYTISSSFTAPCNGFILAASTINVSGTQPVACTNTISINGTAYGSDAIGSSMIDWGTAAVSAGNACTVTSTYTAGSSTGTFVPTSQTVMSIFIPNP